jgi:hypothetical protein
MHYYNEEYNKLWKDIKPGWHETIISLDVKNSEGKMIDVIKWLYDNVDKCERHARWTTTNASIKIKFRYERDYILCTLRWT